MDCHACGTPLGLAARFCHKCGAQVGGPPAAGWRVGLPWALAGLALGALLAGVALRLTGGPGPAAPGIEGGVSGAGPEGGLGAGTVAGAGGGGPLDISQMSAEERATRLYNRVMALHARGHVDSAAFFLPMALQAYTMLPALDVDARYHLGVLHLTGGDAAAALAQADTIRRAVPTHLFALMLRARALELERDSIGARRAYRDFLRTEAAERARGRPEYSEHAQNLETFREQATQVIAGQARRDE